MESEAACLLADMMISHCINIVYKKHRTPFLFAEHVSCDAHHKLMCDQPLQICRGSPHEGCLSHISPKESRGCWHSLVSLKRLWAGQLLGFPCLSFSPSGQQVRLGMSSLWWWRSPQINSRTRSGSPYSLILYHTCLQLIGLRVSQSPPQSQPGLQSDISQWPHLWGSGELGQFYNLSIFFSW